MKKLFIILSLSSFTVTAQTPTISFDFNGNMDAAAGAGVSFIPSGASPTYTYDRFGNPNGACNLYNTTANNPIVANFSSVQLPAGGNARSISLWVHYIGHSTADGNNVNLFQQGTFTTPGSAFFTVQTQESAYFMGNNADLTPPNSDIFKFDSQNWYHYVITFDGSQVGIYRNGNLVGIGATTPVMNPINTNSSSLIINPNGSLNTNGYGYVIDDLDIFDVALTEAQIHAMYVQDSPLNQVELIGYFPFNTGTNNFDISNNHQFAQDGATPAPTSATGYSGEGLHYTSGQLFSNNTVVPELDGSFTIAYWQKRNSAPVQSYETSMELGGSAYDRTFFSSGAFRDNFGMAIGASPSWANFSVPEAGSGISYIAYGEWQHHAFVFDTLTNQLFYYIDGELRKSLGVVAGGIHTFTNKMTLGGGTDGNGVFQAIKSCTNFDLDELFVFNRALSQAEIMALRYQEAVPIMCPTGDVTLTTQQEVNDLWSCTHITGNLTIDDGVTSSITDLSPLNNLTTIDGNVLFQQLDVYNIDALNGVTSVGGTISFINNTSTGISGFSSLPHIPGDLIIQDNSNLNFVHGFVSLDKIGTDENVGEFIVSNNPGIIFMFDFNTLDTITAGLSLENLPMIDDNTSAFQELDYTGYLQLESTGFDHLTAFTNLSRIGNGLLVLSNTDLFDLEGLDNIVEFTQVGGIIEITNNPLIHNLNALATVNFNLPKSVNVEGNNGLTSITGLAGVSGDLGTNSFVYVVDNPSLFNLNGLDGITSASVVRIINNSTLTTLSGLNGLSHTTTSGMMQEIGIKNNAALTSLNGLSNLVTLAANCPIVISNNAQLSDISSLNSLDVNTISSVEIQNNIQLATCNEIWLCNYLSVSSPVTTISGNASGCNSTTEISSGCSLGIGENTEIQVVVYPNPVKNILSVETKHKQLSNLKLVDIAGNTVLESNLSKIDLTHISTGVYYLHIFDESGTLFTEKVIKQ